MAFLIVSMNFIYFVFLLFDKTHRSYGETAIGTLIVYVIYTLYKTRKQRAPFYFDEWVFFALMLLWIDNYIMAIVNLLFMLQFTAATQPIAYHFADQIKQKNFPWKKYQWSEISNIILKDNILTIDLLNNKIIQGEIVNDIDEKAFNKEITKHLS